MYEQLGSFVSRHWVLVILFWIALALGINFLAPDWDAVTNDGDLAYLPSRMTTVRGEELLARAFPEHRSRSEAVLILSRGDGPLSDDDLRVADRLATRFAPEADHGLPIVQTWTHNSDVVGSELISRDRRAALVLLLLSNEFLELSNMKVVEATTAALDELRQSDDLPKGLQLGISGSAAVGGDMLISARESIRNTELYAVLLVLVILLFVYRAPVLVLVPLAVIIVSVMVAVDLVAMMTQIHQVPWLSWINFQIFKTTKIFLVTLLFGSGTDFCLFLISRYKEELHKGLDRAKAVANALAHVGDALLASALTTAVGLGMMAFADFGKFRNAGPAIALCLLVTLAACMTLAPALLRALGGALFWPFGTGVRARDSDGPATVWASDGWFGGFWHWVSRVTVARPGLILVAAAALLLPLARRGTGVEVTYDLLSELRGDRPSVQGTRLLQQHYLPGETGPVTVLAYRKQAGFDTDAGGQEVARLTKLLYDIPGVAAVRSIAEPLGDPPGMFNAFSPAGRRKLTAMKNPLTRKMFLSQQPGLKGDVTRLDVILNYDPFSREAVGVLGQIEQFLGDAAADPDNAWSGTSFDFVGTTAATRDLQEVTKSDQALIQKLVVLAVLAVLVMILRRPMICVYLIVTVLLSYLVAMGITDGVLSWYYDDYVGLDWKVPIFLFVILVAVGEDYNIYLCTRVFEEQRRLGPLAGLEEAIAKTGGIITSCGVIMAGTFLSMMSGTLRGMFELGFALSLGVMLDTFVVRPILVPAFLALVYRRSGETVAVASDRQAAAASAERAAAPNTVRSKPIQRAGSR